MMWCGMVILISLWRVEEIGPAPDGCPPEGVSKKLGEITANWIGPPALPGQQGSL